MTQIELKKILSYDPLTGIFKWNKSGHGIKKGKIAGTKSNQYVRIWIKGQVYSAQNLAWLYMTGSFPIEVVDHEDHNAQNNVWSNLKAVSNHDNNKNKGMNKNNTSGKTGVCWTKKDKRWLAYIYVNKKRIHLLSTKNISLAIKAREEAEVKYGFHKNHGK